MMTSSQSAPVRVTCRCGHKFSVAGDAAPDSVRCEWCGQTLAVPPSPVAAVGCEETVLSADVGVGAAGISNDETTLAHQRHVRSSIQLPRTRSAQMESAADSAHTQVQGALAVGSAMANATNVDFDLSGSRGMGSGASRLAGIDLAQRFTPASGVAAPQADDPSNATIYGIHLIIRNHARGGMGQIVVAYDQFLKREVALKELRPEVLGDTSVVHRFVSEAEITAQLEHPGIVPVHVLGLDADGHPYYTMKLIRGKTLHEAIKEYHKKPDKATLMWLVRRLVAASQPISFAHARGVIHRDLKPANIMFGEHNETLVMDWGLAKVYRADQPLTTFSASEQSRPDKNGLSTFGSFKASGKRHVRVVRSKAEIDDAKSATQPIQQASPSGQNEVDHITVVGTVVGTPAFMSPEQANPDSTEVGPQTDVYGMGAVLYTILTGRPPFTGKSGNEVLEKVRSSLHVPADQVKKGVPADLSAICEKATARNLAERYASIDEFAADLCRWLDGEPVSAVPWTLWRQIVTWERRWRGFTIGVLVTALCVAATADVFWSYINAITRRSPPTSIETQEPHDLPLPSRE